MRASAALLLLFAAACSSSGGAAGGGGELMDEEVVADTPTDEVEPEPEIERLCEPGAFACVNGNVGRCAGDGGSYLLALQCDPGTTCEGLRCVPVEIDEDESEVEPDEADGTDADNDDVEASEPEPEPEPEPDEAVDTAICTAGELRCSQNRVERCLAGRSWFVQQVCGDCATCEANACVPIDGCVSDGDPFEELDWTPPADRDEDNEPEPEPQCDDNGPAVCLSDDRIQFCDRGRFAWRDCRASAAVCALVEGEPQCRGIQGAACDIDNPAACADGFACRLSQGEYRCEVPTTCPDVISLTPGVIEATTTGYANDYAGASRCRTSQQNGADVLYSFFARAGDVLDARLSGPESTRGLLTVFSDCAGTGTCAPGVTYDGSQAIIFRAPADGTYYLSVDSTAGDMDYTLTTRFVPPSTCRNPAAVIDGSISINGDTRLRGADFSPAGACRFGGSINAPGEDVFYRLRVPARTRVRARLDVLDPGVRAALYTIRNCDDPACEYGAVAPAVDQSVQVDVTTNTAVDVILVVDEITTSGFRYALDINFEFRPSGCGAGSGGATALLAAAAALFARRRRRRG